MNALITLFVIGICLWFWFWLIMRKKINPKQEKQSAQDIVDEVTEELKERQSKEFTDILKENPKLRKIKWKKI